MGKYSEPHYGLESLSHIDISKAIGKIGERDTVDMIEELLSAETRRESADILSEYGVI